MYKFKRKAFAKFGITDHKEVSFDSNGLLQTEDREVVEKLLSLSKALKIQVISQPKVEKKIVQPIEKKTIKKSKKTK